jgi:hypothetical protein
MMTYCLRYKCHKCRTLATSVASVTNIILSSSLCRVLNDIIGTLEDILKDWLKEGYVI